MRLRACGDCSVICCKPDMKEAESKITRSVHLLKRKKGAQVSNACMFAVAQDAANASVHVRRACYGADTVIFPSPHCLLPTALALMLVPWAGIDCMDQGAGCETAGRRARQLLATN